MKTSRPKLARGSNRKRVPRPHQQEAVNAAVKELSNRDRATVVMACGTGKTGVGLWSALRICRKGGTILALFPSLALIGQTLSTWLSDHTWTHFSFVAVCSDLSLDDEDAGLEELDCKVTTSADELLPFLSAPIARGAVRVIFATYHSSAVVGEAAEAASLHFDLAIFDEAHRTAEDRGAFGYALDETGIRARKRLFLTATPRQAMDGSQTYGAICHHLSFREAMRRGLICSYKILLTTVSRQELGIAEGDTHVAIDGVLMPIAEAVGLAALARSASEVGARKAITFHSTIAAAETMASSKSVFARYLPQHEISHVNGTQSSRVRGRVMKNFKRANAAVMTNARCLTEGVDVPAIDLVGFVGRRGSRVDIIQAIGRCLRKDPASPMKVSGYVMVPLLLNDEDEAFDLAAAIAAADLDLVWEILETLTDDGMVFAEATSQRSLDEATRERALDELGGLIQVLGIGFDIDNAHKAIKVRLLDGMRERRLGGGRQSFGDSIALLKAFVAREGHAQVMMEHREGDFRLGRWVGRVRKRYHQGELSEAHIEALENVPGWRWRLRPAKVRIPAGSNDSACQAPPNSKSISAPTHHFKTSGDRDRLVRFLETAPPFMKIVRHTNSRRQTLSLVMSYPPAADFRDRVVARLTFTRNLDAWVDRMVENAGRARFSYEVDRRTLGRLAKAGQGPSSFFDAVARVT